MCFKMLANKLIGRTIGKEIDWVEMEYIIKQIFPDVSIWSWDTKYRKPPLDKVIKFIHADLTNLGIYVENFKDCDDFAVILWGLWKQYYGKYYTTFGLVLTNTPRGPHAANIFLDDNDDVWLLEPQNDRYWLAQDKLDWKPYIIIM